MNCLRFDGQLNLVPQLRRNSRRLPTRINPAQAHKECLSLPPSHERTDYQE
jgi:hypothetical protein